MAKELLRSSNYWVLNKKLVKELGIETAFMLTNLIEAEHMMKTKDGWFFQTIEKLEEVSTLTRRKQDVTIKELESKGFIDVKVKGMPAKRYFKINNKKIVEVLFGKDLQFVRNEQTSLYEMSKQVCTKRTTSKESIYKESINKELDYIVEIVNYLNDVADKNYRHTTRKTQQLIKARMNEGFTVDDFKEVIDKKSKDWKHDKKMNRYLRPETLFGTKFEGYLNENVGSTRKVADF